MIKVKLTPNYAGFNIAGTFDDFYGLYDSISYFLGIEQCEDIFEEDMRLHILGFLYDFRHAYQGSRNIKSVDNGLSEEQKEYYGINKSIKKDITNYNGVMTFYGKVIDALQEILTENQVKRVRKILSESSISERYWLKQWFMIVSIDYLKMTKNKRKREMMHIIESLCDLYLYDEYHEIKNEVEQYSKENNIIETEIEYGEYPKEIEW